MPRRYRNQSQSRRRSSGRGSSRGYSRSRSSGRGARARRQRRQNRILAVFLFILVLSVGYAIYLDSLQGPQWMSGVISQHRAPAEQPSNSVASAASGFLSRFKHRTHVSSVAPAPQAAAVAQASSVPAPAPKPAPAKPHFDFYNMLTKSKPKSVAAPSNRAWVGQSQYHLQVAELKDKQKAEMMQDKLALAGFPVTIMQSKSLLGNHYRVMVGPFQNLMAAHETQNELQRFGVRAVLR